MMVEVVNQGTGTAAQIDGVAVAGKTGTAQTADGAAPHAWFIAFAPADAPRVRGGGHRRARRQPRQRGDRRPGRRTDRRATMLQNLLAEPDTLVSSLSVDSVPP